MSRPRNMPYGSMLRAFGWVVIPSAMFLLCSPCLSVVPEVEFEPYLLPVSFSLTPEGLAVRFQGPHVPLLIGHLRVGLTASQAFREHRQKLVIDMCISNRHFGHKKAGSSEAVTKDRMSAGRRRTLLVRRQSIVSNSLTLSG